MKTQRTILSIVITAVLAVLTSAAAASVTLTYDGTVYQPNMVPSFNVGDPFQVTFTFDPLAPDLSPDITIGQYWAVSSLSFTIGSYSGFIDVPAPIQVGNDYTGQGGSIDYWLITSDGSQVHGPSVGGWSPNQFVLQFVDLTHSAFTSDALPLTALNPSNFLSPNTFMSVGFVGPGGDSSVNAHVVPEPSAAILLSCGVVLCMFWRSGRKRAR